MNPANPPIKARKPANCHTLPTRLIRKLNRAMAKQDRSTMSLRPRRSATRPHSGEANAATSGVTADSAPTHRSICAGPRTPSCGRNNGITGLSTVKPMFMPSWMPIMRNRVRCQLGAKAASAVAGLGRISGPSAGAVIAPHSAWPGGM